MIVMVENGRNVIFFVGFIIGKFNDSNNIHG